MFKKLLFLVLILFFLGAFSFAQSENATPLSPLPSLDKGEKDDGKIPSGKKNNTNATPGTLDEGSLEKDQGKEVLDKDGKSLKSKGILSPEGNQEPKYPAGHKPIKISDKNCPVT